MFFFCIQRFQIRAGLTKFEICFTKSLYIYLKLLGAKTYFAPKHSKLNCRGDLKHCRNAPWQAGSKKITPPNIDLLLYTACNAVSEQVL